MKPGARICGMKKLRNQRFIEQSVFYAVTFFPFYANVIYSVYEKSLAVQQIAERFCTKRDKGSNIIPR